MFIDQEWLAEAELPTDYLIYFSFLYLFRNQKVFPEDYTDKKHRQYNITATKMQLFLDIEQRYYQEYAVINTKVKAKIDGCKTYKLDQPGVINQSLLDLCNFQNEAQEHDPNFLKGFKQIITNSLAEDSPYFEREFLYPGSSSYMLFPKKPIHQRAKKSILLVTHELSRTGAPIVVLDTAKVLVENGYFVTVVSLADGPLRNDFLEAGVPVIISTQLRFMQFFNNGTESILPKLDLDLFVDNFDEIIMVTATLYNFVRRYMNLGKRIFWWIHEGKISYDIIGSKMPKYLTSNIKVLCGGQYAMDQLKNYGFQYDASILNYGVRDKAANLTPRKTQNRRIRFLSCGSINIRKGQHLLLEAIKKIPSNYLELAEFIFIGDTIPGDIEGEKIKDQIIEASQNSNQIKLYSSINRDELFKLYQEIDVLALPSLDDPMPVVATETFMLSNICLCSDCTGTSTYIHDGKNGFVFKSGNVDELAEKIIYILQHPDKLDQIRVEGRKIYEKFFHMQIFEKNLLKLISHSEET